MLNKFINYKKFLKNNNIINLKKKNYKNFFLSIQNDPFNSNTFLNKIKNKNPVIFKCNGFFNIPLKDINSLLFIESLFLFKNKLSINNKELISFKGILKKPLHLKITGFLFCFKTKQEYFLFLNFFFKTIQGLYFGWNINLEFININYKIYINIKKKFLTIFIGQSHGNIILYNPNNIFLIIKKKKKFLKMLSFNKKEITYLAFLIKNLRPISKYKNKGIKYDYEFIKFKQGKAKQR